MNQVVALRWRTKTWRAGFFYNIYRTGFIKIIEGIGGMLSLPIQ